MADWIPPHYSKLGKKVKDLLGKTFDIKNELKTINKSANGVTLESSFNGDTCVSGTSKGTYKKECYEAEAVVKTAGEVNLKVVAKKLAPGLEVSLQGKSKKQQLVVEAKYAQPFYATCATITHNLDSKTLLDGAFMIGFDGLSVGVSGQLDVASEEKLTDYNCGAEYTQDDLTLSLFTQNLGSRITASYWQRLSGECNLGASLKMDPDCAEDGKGGEHCLTVGVQYKLDAATKLAVKGDTTGTVCTNIEHVLSNPSLKLGIGASFDSTKTCNVLAADCFGISCTFGDF